MKLLRQALIQHLGMNQPTQTTKSYFIPIFFRCKQIKKIKKKLKNQIYS